MTAADKALIVKALRRLADSGGLDALAAERLADRLQFDKEGS